MKAANAAFADLERLWVPIAASAAIAILRILQVTASGVVSKAYEHCKLQHLWLWKGNRYR